MKGLPKIRHSSSPLARIRLPTSSFRLPIRRTFVQSPPRSQENRIHQPVRSPSELSTLLLTSSAHQPLITLFTASWCSSCRSIKPLLTSLIETHTFSRPVSYAEIEVDSPDNGALATEYFVNSIPTLLSFRAGEAALGSKVTDVREMADREFLRLWIESEAGKGGDRGGSGGVGMGVFGGLFGIGDK